MCVAVEKALDWAKNKLRNTPSPSQAFRGYPRPSWHLDWNLVRETDSEVKDSAEPCLDWDPKKMRDNKCMLFQIY